MSVYVGAGVNAEGLIIVSTTLFKENDIRKISTMYYINTIIHVYVLICK